MIINVNWKIQKREIMIHSQKSEQAEQGLQEIKWFVLNRVSSNISSPIQALSLYLDKIITTQQWQKSSRLKGISNLLGYFRAVYAKPKWQWHDVVKVLESQSHPADRQLIWFYPLSEYLRKISSENNIPEEAISILCERLGVQVQRYRQPLHQDEICVTTKEAPVLFGSELSLYQMKMPVLDMGNQWINLTQDHIYAATYNNLIAQGIAQTTRVAQKVGLETVKSIIDKQSASATDVEKINLAVKNKNYVNLAQVLEKNHKRKIKLNIEYILSTENWALILTFGLFCPDMRNELLSQPQKYMKVILPILHAQKFVKADFKISDWSNLLDTIIPTILRTEGDTELHTAIRRGNVSKALEHIKAGHDFYKPNSYGNTALHIACYVGMVTAIEQMIAMVISKNRQRPWYQRMIQTGLNISLQNKEGLTPVHYAVQNPKLSVIQALLDSDKNPTNSTTTLCETDKQGRTALHFATLHPNQDVLLLVLSYIKTKHTKTLSNNYAVLDRQDERGLTALHYAALQINRPEQTKALLDLGASTAKEINPLFKSAIKDQTVDFSKHPVTPFSFALEAMNCDAISYLLNLSNNKKGIVPYFTDSNILRENSHHFNVAGIFALHGRTDLIKLIHNNNTYSLYQYQDSKGRLPIHIAAMAGDFETFVELLKPGIGLLALVDNQGFTALHYAAMFGHSQIVDKICQLHVTQQKSSVAQKENIQKSQNTVSKIFHQQRKRLSDLEAKIDLNATTKDGETAFILASLNDHKAVLDVLRKNSVDESSMAALFLNTITRSNLRGLPSDEVETQFKKDLQNASKISSKYAVSHLQNFVYNSIDPRHPNNGNTFVHLSVVYRQYRYLCTLLHPLKQEDRLALCKKKNALGLTAYDLLKQAKAGSNADDMKELEKIERLLIQYMPEVREKFSLLSSAEYHFRLRQDFREELLSSSGYSASSDLMHWGPLLFKAGAAYVAKGGYAWFLGEAIYDHYIGGDILYNTERTLRFINGYASGNCQTFLSGAADFVHGIGWVTQTTNRFVTEAFRQSFAWGGHQYFKSGQADSNYQDALNQYGFLLGLSEGLYRHGASEYINAWFGWSGIDTYFSPNYGLNGLLKDGLKHVNDFAASTIKLDVEELTKSAYRWARENIGQVPPAAKIFDEKFADGLKEKWQIKNKDDEKNLLSAAKLLFEQSYDYGKAEVSHYQMSVLTHCVTTGVFNDASYQILANVAILMNSNGLDANSLIIKLTTQSEFIDAMEVEAGDRKIFQESLKNDLELIDYSDPHAALTDIKEAVSKSHGSFIVKDLESKKAKLDDHPFKDEATKIAAKALIDAHLESDDYYRVYQDANMLVYFIYTGNIPGDEEQFLEVFDYSDQSTASTLSQLYISSHGYGLYAVDDAKTTEYAQTLESALQEAIDQNKPILKVFQRCNNSLVNGFMQNSIIPELNATESNFDQQFKQIFVDSNISLLSHNWRNLSEQQDIIIGMQRLLANTMVSDQSATLEEHAAYIEKVARHAKEKGHDESEVIKLLFINSAFVRQFNLDAEFINEQAEDIVECMRSAKISANQSVLAVALNLSVAAIVQKYVDENLIQSESYKIEDPHLIEIINVGVVGAMSDYVTCPELLNTTLNGAFDLIHFGSVTEDSLKVLEEIASHIEDQGGDSAEAMAYLLLHSKQYQSIDFNRTTKEKHHARLVAALKEADENHRPLSEVFNLSEGTEAMEYVYPLSQKGIKDFESAHAHNFLQHSYSVDIHAIINSAYDNYAGHPSNARNLMAAFIADEIIRYRYPYFPAIGDEAAIIAEREQHFSIITNDKLASLSSSRKKCENDLYNYINAQITGEVKQKRGILKSVLSAFSGGKPSIQAHSNLNGGMNVNATFLNQPVFSIYSSQKSNSAVISVPKPGYMSATQLSVAKPATQFDIALANSSLPDYLKRPFETKQSLMFVDVIQQSQQSIIDGLLPSRAALEPSTYTVYMLAPATSTVAKASPTEIKSVGQMYDTLNTMAPIPGTSIKVASQLEVLGMKDVALGGELPVSSAFSRIWSPIWTPSSGLVNGVVDGANAASEYAQLNVHQLFKGEIPAAAYAINDLAASINKQIYKFLTFQPTIIDEHLYSLYAYGNEELRRHRSDESLLIKMLWNEFIDKPLSDHMYALGHAAVDLVLLEGAGRVTVGGLNASGQYIDFASKVIEERHKATLPGWEMYAAKTKVSSGFAEISSLKRLHPISGKASSKVVEGLYNDMIKNGFDLSQPIEVFKIGNELYVLDGHHRLKAAKLAGIQNVCINYVHDIKNHYTSWSSAEEVLEDALVCMSKPDKIKISNKK